MGSAINVMLGLWLVVSPFILRFPSEATSWWIHDIGVGFAIVILACLSAWRRTEIARLGVAVVAIGLVVWSWTTFDHPRPPVAQNRILLGWLLLMLSLLPREAFLPPEGWRRARMTTGRESAETQRQRANIVAGRGGGASEDDDRT